MWYFYVLECSDGSFYSGVTPDYIKRLEKHSVGKASVYTKKRRPVTLKYVESFKIKHAASDREIVFKKLDIDGKSQLIEDGRGIKEF
ncbi:MAG: putative endonuclease [Candidatus Omnitrophota bacterium]|jgi:putative endonuclease